MEKKNVEIHLNEIKHLKEKHKVELEALRKQHAEVIRRYESEIMMLKQRPKETIKF